MNNKSNNRLNTSHPLHVVDKASTHAEGLAFNRNNPLSEKVDISRGVIFDHPSRWEVIERNLREGKEFLREQDKQLKLAGVLLDHFRKALVEFDEHEREGGFNLHSQIFSCGIKDISSETYKGISLFGNNTQTPLKFHICESGERKVIEVNRGDLSGPALQAIVCGTGFSPPSANLLLEATREILELRALNFRQSENLQRSYSKVQDKLESLKKGRKSLLGKADLICSSERKKMYVPEIQGKTYRKVPVAKRLVDFFITAPMHKFTWLTQRRQDSRVR